MKKSQSKQQKIARRHRRIRAKVKGTPEQPRLAVYRSNRYIYAQVIDDAKGATIAAFSSMKAKGKTFTERAESTGAEVAKLALAQGVKKVVFDRGGFQYKGRIKALADSARKAGLTF